MKNSVIVVGGGIMGASAAYWLSRMGCAVTILEQFETPNRKCASGDHLRTFRMTYGKDAFYTEMAVKSLPLWLELCQQSSDKFLEQNGFLDLATKTHGYEEHSFKVLKDMAVPVTILDKEWLRRHYPMINARAVKYGVFHKEGGMIWATRAVSAILGLAQRKGVRVRPHVKITALVKSGGKIKVLKDSLGRTWAAENYIFASGAWVTETLKNYRLPISVTRQEQLYLRPPCNRGRYRPEHFPPFLISSQGFYGFPLHIHGFLKIGSCRKGLAGKPGDVPDREVSPAFMRKCRTFLKRFMPELATFSEFEGHISYYASTNNGDFILDRLPDVANGFLAAGFSGHGFKFAPLIGQALAQRIVGGKTDLNLHRFRLNRG